MRLRTIALISTLALGLLVAVLSAEAQQAGKVYRIGYLSTKSASTGLSRLNRVRQALRDLGYVEGTNIVIESRFAEGKSDRLGELAAELVRLKVDIIVVTGTGQAQAAMNATKTIPIVMMGSGSDPVKAGLVESLARPGGNVTGVTLLMRELAGKRLVLLKEAVPKVARVAVLYDPALRGPTRNVKEVLPVVARALGLTVQPWEVRSADDFDRVFAALNKDGTDGLYLPARGPLMAANVKRVVGFALKNQLPSMYYTWGPVNRGGLMSYSPDIAASRRRVAYYVDRILKGAKPGDLPVEQPTKFLLVINLKTAKQIGVTIPPQFLARADRVIK